MIERERERRQQLQAEEEARISDEKARLRAEQERLIRENTAEAHKDRKFLIALRIPEYLQEIIDEERLIGAYVLWRPIEPSDIRPDDTEVIGGNVSLVWNIGYTESYRQVRSGGSDNMRSGGGTRVSWESIGKRNGYAYKSIYVTGNSKNNSIEIHGSKDEPKPIPSYGEYMNRVGNFAPRVYLGGLGYEEYCRDHPPGSAGLWTIPTRIGLSGAQLDETQIKRALSATYLDTKGSSVKNRVVFWPFDRSVPEQERWYRSDR